MMNSNKAQKHGEVNVSDSTEGSGGASLKVDTVLDPRLGLKRLRSELLSVSLGDRAALDLARLLSPDFVENEFFLMLFLQSDSFDVKSAASRLVRHFQKKIELFGPNRLVHSIELRDLSTNDRSCLSLGGIAFLPLQDKQGKSVVVTRYSKMQGLEPFNIVSRNAICDPACH